MLPLGICSPSNTPVKNKSTTWIFDIKFDLRTIPKRLFKLHSSKLSSTLLGNANTEDQHWVVMLYMAHVFGPHTLKKE